MTIDLFGKIHTFTHLAHKGKKKKSTRETALFIMLFMLVKGNI